MPYEKELINKEFVDDEQKGKGGYMFEGIEVRGTPDMQKFYDTLARILSQKYNLHITVKTTSGESVEKGVTQNAI